MAVFFAVLAVVVWGSAFVFAGRTSLYSYNVNGLLVQSNSFDPKTYFAELGDSSIFIVSPEMHETVSAADSQVFNASNVFSVVLNGNSKTVVLLYRVLDSGNTLSYCITNKGDVTKSEKISKEDCLAQLSSEESVKILLDSPNDSVAVPYVLLEKNRLSFKTKNPVQLGNSAFIVVNIMYSNAADVINYSNQLISDLLSKKTLTPSGS